MIDRRQVTMATLVGITAAASPRMVLAQTAMSRITSYGFTFHGLAGGDIKLADFAGHPFIVVNTASMCGYTPQYAGLQQLWTRFKGDGLMLIGVPSNDFGGQEPGGVKEIEQTAQHQYGVTFPITAKTAVRGADAHPFYKWAAIERPKDVPNWNFHKYLIGTDGNIADVFASEIDPTDTRVITAIARQISGPPRATQ